MGRQRVDWFALDKTPQALIEWVSENNVSGQREEGEIPSRPRRCEWGRNPQKPLSERVTRRWRAASLRLSQ